MSCLGVHFALSPEDRERVLDTLEESSLIALIQEDLEERYLADREWAYETDKAWDAIHRCLTDGTLNIDGGSYPLKLCVLGGAHLYSEDDYLVCMVDPSQVADVARDLGKITKADLREKYFRIDSSDYGLDLSEDDFEYTWANFEGLPAFFAKAADAGRAVLFTADQ
jgi:hypothetical protein